MAFVEAGGGAAMSTDHGQEPIHDPIDLLDELDSIIRAQEMLRHRTIALQARYAALQPHADRFDNYPAQLPTFGRVNIESAGDRLGYAARDVELGVGMWLAAARESAVKVREYPQSQRSAERPEVDRRRSR